MNWGLRQLGTFAAIFFGVWFIGGGVFWHEWFDWNMTDSPGPLTFLFHYLRSPEWLIVFFGLVWGIMLFVLNRYRLSGKDPVLIELEKVRKHREEL